MYIVFGLSKGRVMRIIKLIVSSALAGIAISIGGIAFLVSGQAWTFPIGLFMVCLFELDLFTGKVSTVERLSRVPDLIIMVISNMFAAMLMGEVMRYAKPQIVDAAVEICTRKVGEGFALVPLAILCNVMIYTAVYSYNNRRSAVRMFGLFFATFIFVLCGFEHCVANAFYFSLAGMVNGSAVAYLVKNAVFNAVGGIAAYRLISLK